ncbi:VTT domain-containing protein [Bacillus shivajii]|uniref:TVP38/TMEM64 family protein n=1 Tax=Bacillus shivajii TaxID=1983719 RepID=UPI001CFB3601|nr:VTT domain-containing protein [Bacillus shivajii]UCZ51592.1 VTT domain-containing protein [Bacillus shivajii]
MMMIRKLIVTLTALVTILLLFIFHESFLHWIQNNDREHIVLTTVIATFMSLFPVIPYPIVGGVIGAAYGPMLGAFVIWMGSTFASIIFFGLIRYGGFHEWGTKILLKYKATKKVTILFERNAFMSITVLRMIPVIPSILINAYAAISRVPFVRYSIASGLGKVPAMTLFALIGHTIVTDPIELLYMLIIYSIFLTIVYTGYRFWSKKAEEEILVKTKQPSNL